MQFRKSKFPPPEHSLATYVPSGGLHGYENRLEEHRNYWQERLDWSENHADLGGSTIAGEMKKNLSFPETILDSLLYQIQQMRSGETSSLPVPTERIRLEILGAISLSTLCQDLFPQCPDQPVRDARAESRPANVLPDWFRDRNSELHGGRLHLPARKADRLGAANVRPGESMWYRSTDGGLWVERTAPAEFSYTLLCELEPGTYVPQQHLQSLIPHLPSQK